MSCSFLEMLAMAGIVYCAFELTITGYSNICEVTDLWCVLRSAAQIRVAGAMSQSTEVMQAMQQLVKVPEVAKTMQEMSKEMMKAGILEEMMEDTFEGLEDQDELEEAAQEEVDKVYTCITCLFKLPPTGFDVNDRFVSDLYS